MLLESGLLGSLFGGIFRMAPEILKFLDRNNERKHELDVLNLQIEADKLKGAQKIEEKYIDYSTEQLSAISDAFKQQAEADSKAWKWVASLSALVRPSVTYTLFGMYAVGKIAVVVFAMEHGAAWSELIKSAWSNEDFAMLNMILTFWFVGRTIESPKK